MLKYFVAIMLMSTTLVYAAKNAGKSRHAEKLKEYQQKTRQVHYPTEYIYYSQPQAQMTRIVQKTVKPDKPSGKKQTVPEIKDKKTDSVVDKLLEHTNQARRQAGYPDLTLSKSLSEAAQDHAVWMHTYNNYTHNSNRPLNSQENIHYINTSPFYVVQDWVYSPAHYYNLLSGTEVGFGYSGGFWVMLTR